MRDKFAGQDPPKFVNSTTGLDFTTSDYIHKTVNARVDGNITRASVDANRTNKVTVKGQHIRNVYTFPYLTETEISDFFDVLGLVIKFTAHIDNGFTYDAIVEEIEVDESNPLRVMTTVSVISKQYIDPETGIDILTPVLNSYIQRGETFTITWNSHNCTGNVKIELYKAGLYDSDIDLNTDDDGSYVWTVGALLALSTDYSIRITNLADTTIYDDSDVFEIDYGGYIEFDGSDDQVEVDGLVKLPTDKFTFCVDIIDYGTTLTGANSILQARSNTSNFNAFYIQITAGSGAGFEIYYHKYDTNGQYTSRTTKVVAKITGKIVFIVDKTAAAGSRVKIYLNGALQPITDNMGSDNWLNTGSAKWLIGRLSPTATSTTFQMRNIILAGNANVANVAAYQNGNYTAISNKVFTYKCNEDSGNLTDQQGNHTGLVTNADASFYNRT
jgi:hypothetical protein